MGNVKHISIQEIIVSKLFGCFNYQIKGDELTDLLVLYGDNGSGKTTILKLVLYTLSCAERSGHKSEIAKMKFQEFKVTLNNGVSIGAKRTARNLIGSYEYYILKNERVIQKVFLNASDDDLSIRSLYDAESEKKLCKILDYIKKLDLKIFYLSDSRKTLDVGLPVVPNNDTDFYLERLNLISTQERQIQQKRSEVIEEMLTSTLSSLENWIKSKVIEASLRGEQEITDIYLQIIKGVTPIEDDLNTKVNDLRNVLNEVINRSSDFERLGFISDTEVKKILPNLRIKADEKKLQIVYQILEPYIKGLQTKLNSLSLLQQQVSSFIGGLNFYLLNKEITYSIHEGFKIRQTTTGDTIDFNKLSSGERQLILILSNVLLASSRATIFIVDEPEISLNIKWQRNLLKTLLNFNVNRNMQFLMATHSIELISDHNNQVIKLVHNK